MSFEPLRTNTVNLPVVGAVSVAAIIAVGAILFFAFRRKKSVKLTF